MSGVEDKKDQYATNAIKFKKKIETDIAERNKLKAEENYLSTIIGMLIDGTYSKSDLKRLSGTTLTKFTSDSSNIALLHEFNAGKLSTMQTMIAEQAEALEKFDIDVSYNDIRKSQNSVTTEDEYDDCTNSKKELAEYGEDVALKDIIKDPDYYNKIIQEYEAEEEEQKSWYKV